MQQSYGRRLTSLAETSGDSLAVTFAAEDGTESEITWRELESRANRAARLLESRGVSEGDVVVVGLRNSPEHLYATFGAWKLGASVLPLRWDLPAWERDRMLEIAAAKVVDDHIPAYSRLVATSGSTGTPKIIVAPNPGVFDTSGDQVQAVVAGTGSVTLTTSPLYHTNGFSFCYPPLLAGDRIVLMEHFDAARAVDLIERHQVTMTVLVPTMLLRIARLDDVDKRDLASIGRIVYGGATLPEWVARKWLQLIPPERFQFVYGGSEGVGTTMCSGQEWLEHPGTAGKPIDSEILILDEDRQPLPVGEVGQVWMRRFVTDEPFRYIGIPTPEPILDGYRSYGDMGRVDDEGYLYIVDRRQDMIITGGVNVFPAEVEAALSEHPAVADVVVLGIPDPEWGHRVHALVQPTDPASAPPADDLRAWVKTRLAGYKVPKTVEYIDRMPRTAAGKVNRTRLAEERSPADSTP
jgi:bile acid-coenzyme A ligase